VASPNTFDADFLVSPEAIVKEEVHTIPSGIRIANPAGKSLKHFEFLRFFGIELLIWLITRKTKEALHLDRSIELNISRFCFGLG